MHPLVEKEKARLKAEIERCERDAAATENVAKEHGQEKAFKPFIDWQRRKAGMARELLDELNSDPDFK